MMLLPYLNAVMSFTSHSPDAVRHGCYCVDFFPVCGESGGFSLPCSVFFGGLLCFSSIDTALARCNDLRLICNPALQRAKRRRRDRLESLGLVGMVPSLTVAARVAEKFDG
jgi:hypothetical protein